MDYERPVKRHDQIFDLHISLQLHTLHLKNCRSYIYICLTNVNSLLFEILKLRAVWCGWNTQGAECLPQGSRQSWVVGLEKHGLTVQAYLNLSGLHNIPHMFQLHHTAWCHSYMWWGCTQSRCWCHWWRCYRAQVFPWTKVTDTAHDNKSKGDSQKRVKREAIGMAGHVTEFCISVKLIPFRPALHLAQVIHFTCPFLLVYLQMSSDSSLFSKQCKWQTVLGKLLSCYKIV